ncbi:MAG: creatininase family protein [Boseongicola sp. SB0675_bin_26]|nr:creatininase family protein [Boseongicola sp. SB0675_bin_26]
MNPPTRIFADLTQPEIKTQLTRNPLVLFPCGSVEQHAAHLPAGTDIMAATRICELVAELMNGLVLPAPSVGVTPMHMPYEATVTFTPATYQRVVVEICESAAGHGARELLILNWHEGNIPSLAIAAEDLHRRVGMRVATVQACYVAEELYGDACNGLTHAGEIETLAVLAARPDLVHLDRATGGSELVTGQRMDRLRRTRTFQPVLTDIRQIAPSGWYGDPSRATEERGREMMDAIAGHVAMEATELLAQLKGAPD